MADNEPTDVATLETEVAAARARFARTLDKLTDPATHEAMKNEVMERVEGYKDGLLGSVEASARATTSRNVTPSANKRLLKDR